MVTERPAETRRLPQARRYVAAAIAEEETLHQRYREHRALVERWQHRAGLALAKGLEDLARQALERRRYYEALAAAYHTEYEAQRRRVAALKRELQMLEVGGTRAHGESVTSPSGRAARAALWFEANELQPDPVADRLAALERDELLERQLTELKARLARDPAVQH